MTSEDENRRSGSTGSNAAATAASRDTILLVEDEFLIRLSVGDALRDAGYTVVEAASGDEAADILKSGLAIDLVLSDVRMPGSRDGLGLLDLVKSLFPELPVVIMSGHLHGELALRNGASGFLAKPFAIDIMVAMMANKLSERS